MTLAEVPVKWSVILMDRLGPDNFSTLQMKRHVLRRARAHLKVPGCSLVWNALLTKKLPMFLSRLNEINGGCEKILPVSGSFWGYLNLESMKTSVERPSRWLWRDFTSLSVSIDNYFNIADRINNLTFKRVTPITMKARNVQVKLTNRSISASSKWRNLSPVWHQ